MKIIDSAWFYDKLAERGFSLREMARFMELDPSAVSRMLNGERKMSAEEQDQISIYLGIGLEEVAARRRGEQLGFSERTQAAYEHSPASLTSSAKMFGESDIIYRDGKRWIESENGVLAELHPAFGCMKGTMTIPDDLDLTAPIEDVEWSAKLYNE